MRCSSSEKALATIVVSGLDSGKVTVLMKARKGIYKITVRVAAALGYEAAKTTVTAKAK